MIKKEKSNNHFLILGFIFILIGIIFPLSKVLYNQHLNTLDERHVDEFFENSDILNKNINDEKLVIESTSNKQLLSDYIAVIDIPSISLRRGLFSKNSPNNTVDKNIQILNDSDMPNIVNGNFILAGHSGSGRIAFFKNLHKIKFDDFIYIYYNHVKYSYQVVERYIEPKTGKINIYRDYKQTTLTLTTCGQDKDQTQFVVIAELVNQTNY